MLMLNYIRSLTKNQNLCYKSILHTSTPTFLRLAFLIALFFKTSSLATENIPICRKNTHTLNSWNKQGKGFVKKYILSKIFKGHE